MKGLIEIANIAKKFSEEKYKKYNEYTEDFENECIEYLGNLLKSYNIKYDIINYKIGEYREYKCIREMRNGRIIDILGDKIVPGRAGIVISKQQFKIGG